MGSVDITLQKIWEKGAFFFFGTLTFTDLIGLEKGI